MDHTLSRADILRWYRGEPLGTRLFACVRSFILPAEAVLAEIPPGASVLDIACGHGLMLHALARRHPGVSDLHGIDLDGKRLGVARRTLAGFPKVRLFEDDILEWEPPCAYDCILLLDILHHLSHEGKRQVLARLKGWLAPGGRVIVKDVNTRPRWKAWVNTLHDLVVARVKDHPEAMESVRDAMEAHGLDCLVCKRIDRRRPHAHYLIVGQRRSRERERERPRPRCRGYFEPEFESPAASRPRMSASLAPGASRL